MSQAAADRLRKARIAKGIKSARDAALQFGWSYSTYGSHENGTRGINRPAAERYAKAFRNVTVAELLGVADARTLPIGAPEVQVVASAAVGMWRDSRLDSEHNKNSQFVAVPVIRGSAMRFAVKICDQSVNRMFKEGEFAICSSLVEGDIASLEPGTMLFIERIRDDCRELSVRRLVSHANTQLKLSSYSTDSRFTEIVIYPSPKKTEEINIKGRIVGRYTPLDKESD
jgi:hypothetical protein